jgi:hypothetical protein
MYILPNNTLAQFTPISYLVNGTNVTYPNVTSPTCGSYIARDVPSVVGLSVGNGAYPTCTNMVHTRARMHR